MEPRKKYPSYQVEDLEIRNTYQARLKKRPQTEFHQPYFSTVQWQRSLASGTYKYGRTRNRTTDFGIYTRHAGQNGFILSSTTLVGKYRILWDSSNSDLTLKNYQSTCNQKSNCSSCTKRPRFAMRSAQWSRSQFPTRYQEQRHTLHPDASSGSIYHRCQDSVKHV